MSHSLAVVITAALVAALFAGGSALAVKTLTKQDAKQLFYTKKKSNKRFLKSSDATSTFVSKTDADNQYVRTGSSASATRTTNTDLGPNYVDLASAQITTNGGGVLASANVALRDTTAGINQVECFLRVDGTNIDTWVGTVEDSSGARRPIYPLVGSSGNLPAGTHTVLVRCGEAAALTGVFADSVHLVAWNG